MKTADLKMCRLFIALLFVAACEAARSSRILATHPPAHPPAHPPTTTVAPLPTVRHEYAMMATGRTMPPETTTTPPPCPEATDTKLPTGILRVAMKNPAMMKSNTADAFVVFYSDEHLSEEPAVNDRRVQYISGWDGSGTAVVLAEGGAALWVPSAELKRAKSAVSCAWVVLDADDPSQPSVAEWVADHIGRAGRVAADARLTSVLEWQNLHESLQHRGLMLVHQEVLDQLWGQGGYKPDELWKIKDQFPNEGPRRPEGSRIVGRLHHQEYIGVQWSKKVDDLRNEIAMSGADAMIVTALDEVAWLLNIRGHDLPYAPLLKLFVIVSLTDVRIYDKLEGKLTMPVREALFEKADCYQNCTRVINYSMIYTDLRMIKESKIIIPTAGTFQRGASAYIAMSIQAPKRMYLPSPIVYMKAQKNQAEKKGMARAHLRDAVAMCTLLSYLEGMAKTALTELSVGLKVDGTRATQAGYEGLSMPTEVAFGPSAAEPGYRAENGNQTKEAKNRKVLTNSALVIRSGGQYAEGTTVVTRTLHYGLPTREIRTAYTTVLRSLAAMATLQIPATMPAAHIDPVVRAPLWAAKQDYPHPTGHGIGAALNRKEDPVVIDYRQDTNLHTFREGYFITSEPAWYDARGRFGVRLGNVLEVVSRNDSYLCFNETTLVPFEPKLIDRSQLTEYEIKWINAYNDRIRKIVGPELKDTGLLDAYYWMMNKTVHLQPVTMKKQTSAANTIVAMWSLYLAIVVVGVYF